MNGVAPQVYRLAQSRGYSLEELELLREQKAYKRGGFEEKIFLEFVEYLPKDKEQDE